MKNNKKSLKIIFTFMLLLSSFVSVNAQEIDYLEKNTPPPITVDGNKFNLYIEFKNQELAKKYLLEEYADVIQKIKQYSEDEYFDIDDKNFQRFIMSLDVLETDREKQFRNYIDVYENYEKNNEMESLYEQYYNTTDSVERESILLKIDNIAPIDDSIIDNSNSTEIFSAFNSNNNSTRGVPSIMNPLNPGKYTNGYDRNVARDYAWDWAYSRNNTKYGYYSRREGNCEDCWYDCANFISQILYEGGMKQYHKSFWPIVGNIIQENNNNWYYYDDNGKEAPSYSWGGAANFYKHWSKRATVTSDPYQVTEMDPVSIDFEGEGDIDHTVIIFSKNASAIDRIYYAAHSNDRRGDATIADAIGTTGKWYAYKMQTARNDGTFK